MGFEHIVAEDEHLPGIAEQHGFSSFLTIWNHPRNAELKALRKNPNTLLAGDRVFILDRETKSVDGATDQRHSFVVAAEPLELQARILDHGFAPLFGEATLTVELTATPMTQSGEVFRTPIARTVRQGTLDFPAGPGARQRPKVSVQPGRLDPLETLPGQQQRLNNLGYFAGFTRTLAADPKLVEPQMRWAVEEFQCEHMGKDDVDGVLGPKTLARLREVYGC